MIWSTVGIECHLTLYLVIERGAGSQVTHCSVLGASFGHELADMMLSSYFLSMATSCFLRKKKNLEVIKLSS